MREILKKTFDKIYCINLDHRVDRWESAKQELSKYNILDLVTRFPGCIGENGETSYVFATKSHIECIKDAKINNYKNILILEDDFKFINEKWTGDQFVTSNPEEVINNALEQLQDIEWDMLYFSYLIKLPRKFAEYKQITKNVFQSVSQAWANAYGVSNNLYDFILKNDPTGHLVIDQYYSKYLTHRFKCLNIMPMVVCPYTSASDARPAEREKNGFVDNYKVARKRSLRQYYV
tara:strand:- start:267 stop:968 length:702 start_codon:yes stop_codon:yes gene_type:complete